MLKLDTELAKRYGSYASYTTPVDPESVDTFGDDPAVEVDRLLDLFANPKSVILDLGCGAGFTLCRLAAKTKWIYGFEQADDLLAATRQRVRRLSLQNVTLISGNVAEVEDVAQLPDNTFDIILTRRGPDINKYLLPKIKLNGMIIQELYQDPLGLKEIFGRVPFLPQVGTDPHWLISKYRWLGVLPVSVKDYFYEQYFRDATHLADYLMQEKRLSHWRMPDAPYEKTRDEAALKLYIQYNNTPKGIRVFSHRKVYLFRKTEVNEFPSLPDAKPLYLP